MHYVYVLRSSKNNKRYVGFTSKDPKVRLEEHMSGTNSWTRQNKPFQLVYQEEFDQEIEAYAYFYNIDTNQITEDKQIPFTIKLEGICTEEFGYFYGDVFTLVSPDDSDIEAELTEKALEEGITDPIDIKEYMNANKESEIEHWYEMNNYDNKVNWGVGE